MNTPLARFIWLFAAPLVLMGVYLEACKEAQQPPPPLKTGKALQFVIGKNGQTKYHLISIFDSDSVYAYRDQDGKWTIANAEAVLEILISQHTKQISSRDSINSLLRLQLQQCRAK